MNPTAANPAEVTCCQCGVKATGTIDTLRQDGWAWFSNATERFHWCVTCQQDHGGEFVSSRNDARSLKAEAEKNG